MCSVRTDSSPAEVVNISLFLTGARLFSSSNVQRLLNNDSGTAV